MAVARVTTWSSGQTLTATALNAEFDNLLTPINAILPGSYGTGDLVYASSASQWAALGAGTQNFVLQMGASIPAWFNLFGTANTWTANQTISNTAPSLVLADTTGSAKSLTVAVDANLAQLRESAGASGSLLVLDLANNRVGLGTTTPAQILDVNGITGWANGSSTAAINGLNVTLGSGGLLRVVSNDSQAADLGGSIGFGGYYIGQTNALDFAQVAGRKENSTSGNAAGYLQFSTRESGGNTTEKARITSAGLFGIGMSPTQQFELSGSVGQKASGTTWSNPSDARLKDDVHDYTDGLDAIRKIRPVHYTLNGLAGTPKGTKGISVIAQEMLDVMPYTIETYKAKLHPEDTEDTELYRFEASALTFALVNAVKELVARVETLERRN